MSLFRKPDDRTIDAPYAGLDDELNRETLSTTEQKRLKFVRWGIRYNKGRFHEFLLSPHPEDESQDESDDESYPHPESAPPDAHT